MFAWLRSARSWSTVDVGAGSTVDQLVGPIYRRALIVDTPIDEILLDAMVSGMVTEDPTI
jgi:hypothetical protein